MGAPGRPTPQSQPTAPPGSTSRPRFRDTEPTDERAEVNPYLVSHREWGPPLLPADEAWTWRGRWDERFGRDAPLHVEIGPGNGFFLAELARRNPTWNVLGVEIRYKRTVLCAKKIATAGVNNAWIARYHAAFLDDLFEPDTLDGLYVNHPDPWPKARHEKHRLISRWFLDDCVRYLRSGAALRIKSDFRPNVDRVVELLDAARDKGAALPLQVTGGPVDLSVDPAPWPDDIQTNYQRKFEERGEPVYAIEVTRA